MNNRTKEGTTGKRAGWMPKAVILVAAAAALAVVVGLVARTGSAEKAAASTKATFTAQRGELKITINQNGDLQTKNPIKIVSESSGEATISALAAEGSRVKKGDVLVELDSSQLEELLIRRQIEVENSNARHVQAEEAMKIQELTNKTSIANAQLALENAGRAQEKYGTVALDEKGFLDSAVYGTEALGEEVPPEEVVPASPDAPGKGEAYQAFRDAELAIKKAESSLEKAERDFDGMKELLEKDFVTRNDYDDAELKVLETHRSLESAMLKHELLRKYSYPAKIAEIQAACDKAEGGLEAATLSANSQITQKKASITQSERIYEKNQEQLQETTDELEKMTILAPEDGLVLYGEEGRYYGRQQIEVGSKVHRGRVIITLPRISEMMAVTKVLEKDVTKVKVGQKATVTMAALIDLVLEGEVSKVASVASSDQWYRASEAKTFEVEITLERTEARMKPGMSCEVEIMVGTLENCVYVPVNTVFKLEGQDVCHVATESGIETRQVRVGQSNDLYVEIEEGLSEGDAVYLYSVTSEAAQLEKLPATDEAGKEENPPADTEDEEAAPAVEAEGEEQPPADAKDDEAAPAAETSQNEQSTDESESE